MAIVLGGVAGIMCFAGITLLVHRRLFDTRIRKTSSFGDIAVLLLLYAQLILGLATIPVSLGHLDGHEMVKFMTWAQGIRRCSREFPRWSPTPTRSSSCISSSA